MAAEIARRIMREVVVELPLVKDRWKTILFGIVFQYVHGIFTQLAHRMHQPMQEPLHDIGFIVTPELGPDKHWVSEALFGTLFALFVLWTFSPFVLQRKRFYTVVMWSRLLMVLCMCQALRIITFSATQLPGPSFHCRAAEPTARRPWPQHWSGHLLIDVSRQMTKSCGDLIFSSHTTFVLTGTLAYTQYGSWVFMKAVSWFCAAVLSVLIIASRKHYTVDVVIAWYTVPLVFLLLYRRWTTRRPNNGGPDTLQLTPNGTPDHDELLEGEETELQQVLVDKASNDNKFEKLSTAPAQQRSSMAQKLISAVGAEPNGNDASDVLPKLQLPNGGHRARNSSLHMFGEMEREDVRQDDRAVAAPNSMVQRSRAG